MLKTKQEIENWLKEYNIENFTILEDLSVDVDGDVYLHNKQLTHIPIQFNTVWGWFSCSHNSLTSLQGGPREAGGYFSCSFNSLTTLQGAPREVGGYFYCYNNSLTSLQGAPREVGGGFYCHNNKFKTEPDHSMIKIGGKFVWE